MAQYKFHNDCQSAVLTYQQVRRLDYVMDQCVPIYGRGSFPTLYVKLKELIRLVSSKLKRHSINIRDIRLNGGAASYVLAPDNSHYNDLDLLFGTELSDEKQFDVIRDVVLECLRELYVQQQDQDQEQYHQQQQQEEQEQEEEEEELTHQEAQDNRILQSDVNDFSQTQGDDTCDVNVIFDNQREANKRRERRSSYNRNCDDDDNDNKNEDDIKANNAHKNKSIAKVSNTRPQQHMSPPQNQAYQMPLSNCAIKEAYVHKMVKVNDDDCWSLISLGVHQSEANCCNKSSNVVLKQQPQQHHQLDVSLEAKSAPTSNIFPNCAALGTTDANNKSSGNMNSSNRGHCCDSESLLESSSCNSSDFHHNNQRHLTCNLKHHQYQQQQFPNSIELKFVYRMRRKFEFSVDSFQIMLDSLIQFYDFAPQPLAMSRRPSSLSHQSSSSSSSSSSTTSSSSTSPLSSSVSAISRKNSSASKDQIQGRHMNHADHSCCTRTDDSENLLNDGCSQCNSHIDQTGTKSFAILPADSSNNYYLKHRYSIVPTSPRQSIPSGASSSGCSSSSSVVSSSSSSLSCDDDHHEDLEYDSSTTLTTCNQVILSDEHTCVNQGTVDHSDVLHSNNSSQSLIDCDYDRDVEGKVQPFNKGSNGCDKFETMAMKSSNDKNAAFCDCCEQIDQEQDCFSNNLNERAPELTAPYIMPCAVISKNFYPTVIGRSEYGNFKEALYHLENKLIATRSPEEIRGGGLLKYCNLLVKNYKPTNIYNIRTLERYMCSRFFIDFSDLNQQQAKLESYLANHFSDDPVLKFEYLTILHNVVQRSTVCLMNHELRLTLGMIRDLAYKLNENHHRQQETQQQSQPPATQRHRYVQQAHFQSGHYRVRLVNFSLYMLPKT